MEKHSTALLRTRQHMFFKSNFSCPGFQEHFLHSHPYLVIVSYCPLNFTVTIVTVSYQLLQTSFDWLQYDRLLHAPCNLALKVDKDIKQEAGDLTQK